MDFISRIVIRITILFTVIFLLLGTLYSQNVTTASSQEKIVVKENSGVATEVGWADGKGGNNKRCPINVTLTYQNAACGVCDGGLTAVVTGGSGNYSYQWHWGPNGNIDPIPGEINPSITGLCADTLVHVFVTDLIGGCTFSYQSPVLDGNSVIGVNDQLFANMWTQYTYRIPMGDPGTTADDYFYICDNECVSIWIGDQNDPSPAGIGVINVSTGGPPFIYTWSDGATGATGPGPHQFCPEITSSTTYTVTIQDASCLTTTISSTPIVEPIPQPSITILSDSVSCNGACDGGANAVVTGGSGAYIYQWTSGETGVAAAGLCAGTNEVIVTDTLGCVDTANVRNKFTFKCKGKFDEDVYDQCVGGSTPINASATGGDGNYTFSWDQGALSGAGPHSVSPTVTTTYTVLVVDGNSCRDSADVTITIDPSPNANAGADTSLCIGASIQLSASGGNQYVWSPVSELNNPNIPNPIATPTITRTYTVTVTDIATGCSATDDITITVNPLPTVFAGNDASVCSGGSLQLNATGGISYSWAPAGSLDNPNIANPIATPATTTLYIVTATDANGCVASDDINVTVNAANFLTVGPDVGICPGANTTLSATGGTTYSWTPTTGLSNPNIGTPVASPTITTTYTVISSNAGGCQDTGMVTVTVFPPPTANAGNDVEICSGGNIGLNATGGVTYSWTPTTGLSNPNVANPTASPTSTTTYIVTVTDANGCTDTDDIVVTVNPLPNINAGNDVGICIGTSTTLTATGGTTYSWAPPTGLSDPNIANPIASPTATTTYTVTGTDAKGCINTDDVVVTVNPLPNANAGNDVAICTGSSTTLTATGGTTYSWTPTTGLNNSNIASPIASPTVNTTYTVTVTDGNGCVNTDDVVVTVNPLPTVSAGNDQTICSATPTQLQATGTATTYDWFVLGNPTPVSTGATLNVTPSSTTQYVLRGTDAAGCISWDTVLVSVDPTPIARFSAGDICQGNAMTFINTSSGGVNYEWDFGDPMSSSNTSMIFEPLHTYQDSGTYTVTLIVSTAIGCADTVTNQVRVNYVPSPNFDGGQPGCPPVMATFRNTSSDYNPSYTYTWVFGDGKSLTSNDTTVTYTYTKSGIYNVALRVLTPEGCSNQLIRNAYIEVYPMPIADFVADPSITTIYDPEITFSDRSTGADLWFWNFGDGTGAIEQNPRHVYTDTGSFTVWLRVENINGCTDSIPKTILIRDVFTFFAPNAFTPDGDGVNEAFIPQGYAIDYDQYTLYIFDRWGELIYETNDYFAGWDGTYQGSLVETETYVWKVELKDIYGVDHQYIGRVSVIK